MMNKQASSSSPSSSSSADENDIAHTLPTGNIDRLNDATTPPRGRAKNADAADKTIHNDRGHVRREEMSYGRSCDDDAASRRDDVVMIGENDQKAVGEELGGEQDGSKILVDPSAATSGKIVKMKEGGRAGGCENLAAEYDDKDDQHPHPSRRLSKKVPTRRRREKNTIETSTQILTPPPAPIIHENADRTTTITANPSSGSLLRPNMMENISSASPAASSSQDHRAPPRPRINTTATNSGGGGGGTMRRPPADVLVAKELNGLTLQEREDVMNDIHGVSSPTMESSDLQASSLLLLNELLSRIPPNQKRAYETMAAGEAAAAAGVSPSSPSQSHSSASGVSSILEHRELQLQFLRAERFTNVAAAAHRFIRFFQQKLRLFGTANLATPISINHILQDGEAAAAMKAGTIQLLPSYDRSGRAVIVFQVTCVPSSSSSSKDEDDTNIFVSPNGTRTTAMGLLRCFYYMAMRIIKYDESIQRTGFVLLGLWLRARGGSGSGDHDDAAGGRGIKKNIQEGSHHGHLEEQRQGKERPAESAENDWPGAEQQPQRQGQQGEGEGVATQGGAGNRDAATAANQVFPIRQLQELVDALPISLKAIHVCHQDDPTFQLALNQTALQLKSHARARLRIHKFSSLVSECKQTLSTFGLPVDDLPISDDGASFTNVGHLKWIASEQQRLVVHQQQLQQRQRSGGAQQGSPFDPVAPSSSSSAAAGTTTTRNNAMLNTMPPPPSSLSSSMIMPYGVEQFGRILAGGGGEVPSPFLDHRHHASSSSRMEMMEDSTNIMLPPSGVHSSSSSVLMMQSSNVMEEGARSSSTDNDNTHFFPEMAPASPTAEGERAQSLIATTTSGLDGDGDGDDKERASSSTAQKRSSSTTGTRRRRKGKSMPSPRLTSTRKRTNRGGAPGRGDSSSADVVTAAAATTTASRSASSSAASSASRSGAGGGWSSSNSSRKNRPRIRQTRVTPRSEAAKFVYVTPMEHDVLLGRGRSCMEHPGNHRYRVLVDEYQSVYDNAKKLHKSKIANKVVHEIKSGGRTRFLKQELGGWIEVSDDVAREKVSHAFRNRRLAANAAATTVGGGTATTAARASSSSSSSFRGDPPTRSSSSSNSSTRRRNQATRRRSNSAGAAMINVVSSRTMTTRARREVEREGGGQDRNYGSSDEQLFHASNVDGGGAAATDGGDSLFLDKMMRTGTVAMTPGRHSHSRSFESSPLGTSHGNSSSSNARGDGADNTAMPFPFTNQLFASNQQMSSMMMDHTNPSFSFAAKTGGTIQSFSSRDASGHPSTLASSSIGGATGRGSAASASAMIVNHEDAGSMMLDHDAIMAAEDSNKPDQHGGFSPGMSNNNLNDWDLQKVDHHEDPRSSASTLPLPHRRRRMEEDGSEGGSRRTSRNKRQSASAMDPFSHGGTTTSMMVTDPTITTAMTMMMGSDDQHNNRDAGRTAERNSGVAMPPTSSPFHASPNKRQRGEIAPRSGVVWGGVGASFLRSSPSPSSSSSPYYTNTSSNLMAAAFTRTRSGNLPPSFGAAHNPSYLHIGDHGAGGNSATTNRRDDPRYSYFNSSPLAASAGSSRDQDESNKSSNNNAGDGRKQPPGGAARGRRKGGDDDDDDEDHSNDHPSKMMGI